MKVKDVLAKIGDKPLIEELRKRKFFVEASIFDAAAELEAQGYDVFGPDGMRESRMVDHVRELGYYVFMDEVSLPLGYELYRSRRTDEFGQWLRDFFWSGLGRIA